MKPARISSARIALLALALATCACSRRVVVSNVDASDAQRCAIALRAAGLDVTVDRDETSGEGRQRVAVGGDDADYRSALQVLDEHELPRRTPAGFDASASSLIPSPSEERARYIKGLSGEIERMIESIDGVVAADVLVSLPERRPLATSPDEASASAVVSHSGASSPVAADEVRAIVVRAAGSSLTPDHVAVVLKPVVRPESTRPVVRYERDRAAELWFVAAVLALAGAEGVTVWLLRARRRSSKTEDHRA
jgi:type III secretion protein J